MKNKVVLLFFMVVSVTIFPILGTWRDIFNWIRPQKSSVLHNSGNKDSKQNEIPVSDSKKIKEESEKEKFLKTTENKKLNQAKMTVAAGVVVLACILSAKVVIGIFLLAYLFSDNDDLVHYINGSGKVNQIVNQISERIKNI